MPPKSRFAGKSSATFLVSSDRLASAASVRASLEYTFRTVLVTQRKYPKSAYICVPLWSLALRSRIIHRKRPGTARGWGPSSRRNWRTQNWVTVWCATQSVANGSLAQNSHYNGNLTGISSILSPEAAFSALGSSHFCEPAARIPVSTLTGISRKITRITLFVWQS